MGSRTGSAHNRCHRIPQERAQGVEIKTPLSAQPSEPENFLDREFPNYFKEEGHSREEMKAALNGALDSITTLGVIYTENGHPKNKGFFEALRKKVSKIDPGGQAFISGGVVRSLLGYLYQEIYKGKQAHPEKTTWELLQEMISNTEKLSTLDPAGPGYRKRF